MKIEVVETFRDNYEIRKDARIVLAFNYAGYENFTGSFDNLEAAIDFAKKLADNKLTLAYPKTVYTITEVTNETK